MGTPAVAGEPVFTLNLSAASAKDLMLLLQDQVALYEAKYGEQATDFTLKRAAEAKQPGRRPAKRKLNG